MELATTTSFQLPALEDDCVGHGSFRDMFFTLPELVQHVVLHLDFKDWRACCYVSHQWYQHWCPYLWKAIKGKQPNDLSRHGHLIRELDLTLSYGDLNVSHIRNHCLNLTSLRLEVERLDGAAFEEKVLGLEPMDKNATLSPEPIKSARPAVDFCHLSSKVIRPSTPNGFLSNSLTSLELHFGTQGCPTILSRLIEARKAGYLLNLQTFGTGQPIAFAPCVDNEPKSEPPVSLSSVFSFLGAFPSLRSLSTGGSPVQDDLSWTAMEALDRIGVFPCLRHIGLEPGTAAVFEKLIRTMPGVTEIAFHGLDATLHDEVFSLVSTHTPHLTFLSVRQPPHDAFHLVADTDMGMDTEMIAGAITGASYHPGLVRVLDSLPQLESLEVLGGTFSLGAAMAIVESCPCFKSLRSRRASVTITGLQYMLEECETLRILDLDTTLPSHFFFEGSQVRYQYHPSPTTPTTNWSAPLEQWTVGQVHFEDVYELEAFRNRVDYQVTQLRFLKIQDARLISLTDLSDSRPKELAFAGGFDASENWKFPSLEELHLDKFEISEPVSTEDVEGLRHRMPNLKNLFINGQDIFREQAGPNLTNDRDIPLVEARSDWEEFDL